MLKASKNHKDGIAFMEAWRPLFFHVKQDQKLSSHMTSNLALPLLNAGTCWQGGVSNSSSASKKLYGLIGVPIMSSDFSVYRGSIFFSLAFFLEVNITEVSLPDTVAAAAFALVKVYEDHSRVLISKDKSAEPTQCEDDGES